MTRVVFRKFGDGQVIALFPDEPWNGRGDIASYMHVGQHGPASRTITDCTRLATPAEYAPLLAELRGIGYEDLAVRKRMTIKN